jgi:hypothetical protein
VEAPDHYLAAGGDKTPREIGCPRKLVRLNSNEADKDAARPPTQTPRDPFGHNAIHRLVINMDADFHPASEPLARGSRLGQSVEAAERVARQDPSKMPDHVALIVVLGRSDKHNFQPFCPITFALAFSAHFPLSFAIEAPLLFSRSREKGQETNPLSRAIFSFAQAVPLSRAFLGLDPCFWIRQRWPGFCE